jgi:hypothetical protein
MNERGSYLCQLTDDEIYDANIFCDASGMGYGGYITNEAGYIDENSFKLSALVLFSLGIHFEERCTLFSSHVLCISIFMSCNVCFLLPIPMIVSTFLLSVEENNVHLSSKWIPRENKTRADSLSRLSDCDDWEVQSWVFAILDSKWGKHTYDRFASYYNRKCDKLNSKFCCAGTNL